MPPANELPTLADMRERIEVVVREVLVGERGEEFRCVAETQDDSGRVLITVFMDTDTEWTLAG